MWLMLRKYKCWILLPLILLGVQWSVSFWHHHEENSTLEEHFELAHDECFVCDWMLASPTHSIELPFIYTISVAILSISLALTSFHKFFLSGKSSSFFFGRAPPLVIR